MSLLCSGPEPPLVGARSSTPRAPTNDGCATPIGPLRIQRRAEVPFAEIGQDRDDQLAGAFRTRGDVRSSPHSSPGADAAQHALLAGHAAGGFEGVLVLDLDHFINHFHVQVIGNKTRPESLDAMLTRLEFLAMHLLR